MRLDDIDHFLNFLKGKRTQLYKLCKQLNQNGLKFALKGLYAYGSTLDELLHMESRPQIGLVKHCNNVPELPWRNHGRDPRQKDEIQRRKVRQEARERWNKKNPSYAPPKHPGRQTNSQHSAPHCQQLPLPDGDLARGTPITSANTNFPATVSEVCVVPRMERQEASVQYCSNSGKPQQPFDQRYPSFQEVGSSAQIDSSIQQISEASDRADCTLVGDEMDLMDSDSRASRHVDGSWKHPNGLVTQKNFPADVSHNVLMGSQAEVMDSSTHNSGMFYKYKILGD